MLGQNFDNVGRALIGSKFLKCCRYPRNKNLDFGCLLGICFRVEEDLKKDNFDRIVSD